LGTGNPSAYVAIFLDGTLWKNAFEDGSAPSPTASGTLP
jgi:hypothetical protein